jgi:hypothetical protein
LALGDYDAYAFDFPGGVFHAESSGPLHLVADLIRASDGEVLTRAGVDTPQLRIEQTLPPGRYILQVRVMRHAAAGPYAIALGRPGVCTVEETSHATGKPGAIAERAGAHDTSLGVRLEPAGGRYANIGMRVIGVTRGGNADRAGVRAGDILLSIDRRPLRSPGDAEGLTLTPGRTAAIVAVRGDRIVTMEVAMADEGSGG